MKIKFYADYAESWYKTWCPNCKTSNWHCNGDENDLTSCDVEAVRCRKCKEIYGLGPPDALIEEIRDGGNDFCTEDGKDMEEVK